MIHSSHSKNKPLCAYTFWHECQNETHADFLIRTLSHQIKKLAKKLRCGHIQITTTQEENRVGITAASRSQEDIEKIRNNLEENPIRIGKFKVKVKLPKSPLKKAWLKAAKKLLDQRDIKYQIRAKYNPENGKRSRKRIFLFNREVHATTFEAMIAENGEIERLAIQTLHEAPAPQEPARAARRSRPRGYNR